MPRYQEIEIVDIDDPAPVTVRDRVVRKSTGPGGKSPRVAIASRPPRRRLSRRERTGSEKRIECFDIEDDEDEPESNDVSDSDSESDSDGIEVLEEGDPLDDDAVIEEQNGGFCDLCGLHLKSQTEIEKHQYEVHNVSTCKWCDLRIPRTDLKIHLQSSCSKFVKLRGTYCSLHDRIEKEEDLQDEQFKNCRPLSCDTCSQRFELTSLLQREEATQLFVCPGCLHGRVDPTLLVRDTPNIDHTSHGVHVDREEENIEITEKVDAHEKNIDGTERFDNLEKNNDISEKVRFEENIDRSETVYIDVEEENNDRMEILEEETTIVEHTTTKVLVSEILAETLSSLFLTDPTLSSSSVMDIDENIDIVDVILEDDNDRMIEKTDAPEEVRRVARKSTRPPLHPERSAGRTEELQPRCEVPAKRKQSDLTKPPRKVARKSTRPPAHPQKEKEPEVVDLDDEDEDIVEVETETNNGYVMSMLLESPSPDKQDLQELEEMVLS